jgi:hypothetical protein
MTRQMCYSRLPALVFFCTLAAAPFALHAQGSAPARAQASVVRVLGNAPVIDGRLDDAAWELAQPATNFVQRRPVEGAPAAERTEVRFLYDDAALYVGARMYSGDPSAIQAPISRRDQTGNAERLLVSIDAFLDRRTAVTFGLTASGVRLDWYHASDSEGSRDMSFDPVWEGRARTDSLGWTAEMRIPFTQLRFTGQPSQRWGLNITRIVPHLNEESYWVLIPSDVQGWASRFGELTGLEAVAVSRRIELLPYVTAGATLTGAPDQADPFSSRSDLQGRAGLDAKIGLGPSLTLDATFNPDFGQVELDPAEVNLSAFETFFSERRPFFTEGSQLLSTASYFYSRRIGAPPRGPVPYDFADRPSHTRILGAAKVTGRTARGMSVGVLAAVTDRERARYYDPESGSYGSLAVEPLTSYGVARVQQQFGAAGSTAGVIVTGVRREIGDDEPLAAYMNRAAYGGALNWNLRFREGEYALFGTAGVMHVEGDTAAIRRAQRSPARYLHRPDAPHLRYDPSRTSLSGYMANLGLARQSGRHWLWEVYSQAVSPEFEQNDLGFRPRVDQIFGLASLTYRETRPTRLSREYSFMLTSENLWDFGGVRNFAALVADGNIVLPNFWRWNSTAWVDMRGQNATLSRGGPYVGTGQAWVGITSLSSRAGAPIGWSGRIYYGESELGEMTYRLSGSLTVQPSPRWQLSVAPNYLRSIDPRQYVTTVAGGPAATFGSRYVFSEVDRSTLSMQMRLNYAINPDLTLEFYAEPFAASGHFHGFGELSAPRSRELRLYGLDGTTISPRPEGGFTVTDGGDSFDIGPRDFNVTSFRSNLVFRWEWVRGSTLFVVWQQDRSAFAQHGRLVGPDRLWNSLEATGNNVLAVKASYWLGL